MNEKIKDAIKLYLTLGSFLILVCLGSFTYCTSHRVTTSVLSPDTRLLAQLVDRRVTFGDRNFNIYLKDNSKWFGERKQIFRSGDEDFPDIERFIWSKDSTKLLLVRSSRQNFNPIKSGGGLYFLYDLNSSKAYCNWRCGRGFELFTFDDLRNIEFTEPILNAETDDREPNLLNR